MFITINTSSGVPIYRQIVDQVKVAVATGAIRQGDRLPSVRALSETLVINPTTVQRAFLDLERDGIIETRRGQGTFVRAEGVVLPETERDRRLVEAIGNVLAEAQRLRMPEADLRQLWEEQMERFYGAATQGASE